VTVGQTSQATAVTRDANGNTLTGRTVTWTSSNTSVATVNSSGLVTTLAAGSTTITGTSETKTGTATLTVTVAPVATVTVTLTPSSVNVGQTSQASAVTRDANNNVLTGRTVTWTSSNPNVATVNSAGLITTLSAGTTTITGTSETKTGTATLTVTNAPVANVTVALSRTSVVEGATSQATATLRDASNNVLTNRVITWSSSNLAIATVDEDGLVTTHRPGSVTITATSETKSGTATLTVTEAAVARVEVTPSTATVAHNGSQAERRVQLTAKAFDANNRELQGRTFTWSSSSNSIATVSNAGLVLGRDDGTVTITASTGGKSDTATITVVKDF
jgi:uncharacterized protein YjdB